MTVLVAWVEAPFKILATDQNEIFGFPEYELKGESVAKFFGPLSDKTLFQNDIIKTSTLQSDKIQMIIYDRNCNSMQVLVYFEPLLSGGIFLGCLLVFRHSQAITIDNVFTKMTQRCFAQCLVSATAPYEIELVNEAFVRQFGCAQNDILGKHLLMFGPLIHSFDLNDWVSLLLSVGDGTIRTTRICARNTPEASRSAPFVPFQEVFFVPVVESLNGRISHVLVLFSPCTLPTLTESSVYTSSCAKFGLFGLAIPGMPAVGTVSTGTNNNEAVDTLAAISNAAESQPRDHSPRMRLESISGESQSASLSQSPAPLENAPLIRPRRRIDKTTDALPVVVLTPSLLDNLRGRPLPDAARAVGVSVTAFKRACRQLGIRRWPFCRGPARSRRMKETSNTAHPT